MTVRLSNIGYAFVKSPGENLPQKALQVVAYNR